MSTDEFGRAMARNVALYPWFRFFQNLLFWQAVWFLFFQEALSASDAILLYAIYDIASTVLEVPSGYASDRLGRRATLAISSATGAFAAGMIVFADEFWMFAVAQILFGASAAFVSGTDSSMLYESLKASGRTEETEEQELRAWRFAFTALALSAVTGGVLSLWSFAAAFAGSAVAMIASLVIVFLFQEPSRASALAETESLRYGHLKMTFRHPVVVWLFCLSVLMYGYGHLPFVFGQPFILESLSSVGLSAEAPAVSGLVSTLMMIVSVLFSLIVPWIRQRIGLAAILLAAFALQIGLAAVLAATSSIFAIVILFLRMVPSSISGPLIVARLQPLLSDDTRATFLSIKSLVGRLLFASSLWVASVATADVGMMTHAEIQRVLGWYAGGGVVALAFLFVAMRRIHIEVPPGGPATSHE